MSLLKAIILLFHELDFLCNTLFKSTYSVHDDVRGKGDSLRSSVRHFPKYCNCTGYSMSIQSIEVLHAVFNGFLYPCTCSTNIATPLLRGLQSKFDWLPEPIRKHPLSITPIFVDL